MDRKSTVYAICCGTHVKIGFTANSVESRLKELQTGNPVSLGIAASCPGDRNFELMLHDRLKEYRDSGEWFRHSDDTYAVVKEMRWIGANLTWPTV